MRELTELSDEQLQQLDEADLRELATWADAEAARRQHEAVGVRQFLTSPEYLGAGSVPWPGVVDECEAIVEGAYNEAVLPWGVGAGKSVTGALLLCWECFNLLPQIESGEFWARYGLSGQKPLAMFVLASRQQQAESTIFREIRGRLDSSPYFEQEYPTDKRLRSHIVFTRHGQRLPLAIRVLPAREEAVLAADVWACVIDEASWLVESRGPMGDSASEIYDRIKSRMVSRFRGDGLLIVTSAPRHLQDFVQRRSREIEEGSEPKAYTSRRTTWQMVPALIGEIQSGQCFEVQHPTSGAVVKICNSLAGQYARGADTFWRDFGGLPMAAVSPYDPHAQHFLEKCRTLQHLPEVDGGQGVYIHCDIGLRHDACCLAMVMAVGDKATLCRAKIIPPRDDTKEVEISDIREQVRYWRSQGWYIRQVSADSFASESLLQQLRRDGFDVRVVSVDRTPAAYEALKAALHEERFIYFESEATQLFEREYAALELVEGIRVDHPPKGSKDMSDAIAGATCEALANADSNMPLSEMIQF